MSGSQQYCLDANVLIQAWQKYYSPRLCPTYWDVLKELGAAKRIFLPQEVYKEIMVTEDSLAAWLKTSGIPVHSNTGDITKAMGEMFLAHESHKRLVARGRSLADPWVIATAMVTGATVVTKEEKMKAATSTKIKIPDVCDNMGIRCVDDFRFLAEVSAVFSSSLPALI